MSAAPSPTDAQLARRAQATRLVQQLQARHVTRLEAASAVLGTGTVFERVDWLRDEGRHGGGTRFQTSGAGDPAAAYDQASVNVSVIHYDDRPDKALSSATALSAIVHPRHPHVPSMHLHVSHTAMRDGHAYWRVMADLNPSIPDPAHTEAFRAVLEERAGPWFTAGAAQGDRYFAIPALGRTRGVAHFYLEAFDTGDFAADLTLARAIEEGVIDVYGDLIERAATAHPSVSEADRAAQLAYHTLYLFQVLTLDRGTTSGLLVHDQNDVGILGSLPNRIDSALLASWADRVPTPQGALVRALVRALPASQPAVLDDDVRRALAAAVRDHYRAHPEALALQARGDVIPPTVANHR